MKKVLSIVLALAMCLSMATFFTVSAADNPQWWGKLYSGSGRTSGTTGGWLAPLASKLIAANADGEYELSEGDTITLKVGITGQESLVYDLAVNVLFDTEVLELIPFSDDNAGTYIDPETEEEKDYTGDLKTKAYLGTFGKGFGTSTYNQDVNSVGLVAYAAAEAEGYINELDTEARQTVLYARFKVIATEGVDTAIKINQGDAFEPWQANMEEVTLNLALNGGATDEVVCDHVCTIPGEVTKAPTAKETGIQKYVCECGEASKDVELPVIAAEDYIAAEATVSATAPENDAISIKVVAGIAAPDFDAAGFLLEGNSGEVYRYYIENAYSNYAGVDGLAITLKITGVPNIDKVLKITPFTVLNDVETPGEAYSFNISDAFAG